MHDYFTMLNTLYWLNFISNILWGTYPISFGIVNDSGKLLTVKRKCYWCPQLNSPFYRKANRSASIHKCVYSLRLSKSFKHYYLYKYYVSIIQVLFKWLYEDTFLSFPPLIFESFCEYKRFDFLSLAHYPLSKYMFDVNINLYTKKSKLTLYSLLSARRGGKE